MPPDPGMGHGPREPARPRAWATAIARRDRIPLWYRGDHEDREPTTFFRYPSLAARRAWPRARPPPPTPTRERRPGLATFSRRPFETLPARALGPPYGCSTTSGSSGRWSDLRPRMRRQAVRLRAPGSAKGRGVTDRAQRKSAAWAQRQRAGTRGGRGERKPSPFAGRKPGLY